jgi:hypothetical protein
VNLENNSNIFQVIARAHTHTDTHTHKHKQQSYLSTAHIYMHKQIKKYSKFILNPFNVLHRITRIHSIKYLIPSNTSSTVSGANLVLELQAKKGKFPKQLCETKSERNFEMSRYMWRKYKQNSKKRAQLDSSHREDSKRVSLTPAERAKAYRERKKCVLSTSWVLVQLRLC